MNRIVIIGAGPTGLGAAHALSCLGHTDWVVFEATDNVGGLSASFVDPNGFTWDVGGHVLFSHYPYFDEVVEYAVGGECYEHLRESWVRILGRWVPYPFQNNIHHLPREVIEECLGGLRQVSSGGGSSFRAWMDEVFGAGIVRHFMEPYNCKVWGVPLETMSKEWIAERVSVVDLARIERNIAERRDDLSWGPNNKFRFPKRGGTGAIFEGISASFRERIFFGYEMTRVDLVRQEVYFANGRCESYDVLINTTPLDLFINKCTSVPEPLQLAAGELVHNSGLIVGLGFAEKRDDSKCWMYFPEDSTPFYRVTNFHNYSPHNVPEGRADQYFSLMCETTYSFHKSVCKELIVDDTEQGLINSGMIDEADRRRIISRYLIDIPYSYPVPTLGRDRALDIIQPFLESHDVYSRGRFGAWKYEVGNMDHSFMQGVEVVERILAGKEEQTVHGKV